MSAHSENVKAMIQWLLVTAYGPHAKTVPLGALDALVERTETDSGYLSEIRDRMPAGGGASEATLLELLDVAGLLQTGIAGANAWLESLLDDQHGADLLAKLETVRALLAGVLTMQADAARFTESTATLAAAATFTSPARAVAAGELRGLAVADVDGTLYLEVSADGNAPWMRVAGQDAVQVGVGGLYVASIEHKPVLGFARWVFVNGAAGQGSFCLGTALVAA